MELNWKNLAVRSNRFIYCRAKRSHGSGWTLRRGWDRL